MSDREIIVEPPELEAGLHSDVARECRDAWMEGQPWTRIRPLREGVDDPKGHSCVNSQGKFHIPCGKRVEAVQYNVQGVPQFYCEEHALIQNDWDIKNYRSEPKKWKHEFSEEEQREIQKILSKGKKREKEPEAEELDL